MIFSPTNGEEVGLISTIRGFARKETKFLKEAWFFSV